MKTLFTLLQKSRMYLIPLLVANSYGQGSCPPNIGVETGDFTHWQCYTGSVAAVGTTNEVTVAASGPTAGQHLVYSNMGNANLDAYGLFPEKCPNGSNYSIKLGNKQGGKGAERLSYTFTIPASAQNYSLVYWYAVVFQNPDHQVYQQPRFVASVFDQQSNSYINCASFTYVGSSGLPGFEQSTVNREVVFKKWSPVTVNLSGYAGHTIRMEFTTADCTQGGHFGYAYIDINEQCSQPVQGAIYCSEASTITLTAPYGYQSYNWYNSTFTQALGSNQMLTLSPPPADGTRLAVAVVPYEGFGCKDTLYTVVKKVPVPTVSAGADATICSGATATIGQPASSNYTYQWLPATALANPQANTTTASPMADTRYIVTATDPASGCTAIDSVDIQVKPLPVAAFNASPACIGKGVALDNTTTYTGTAILQYAWSFGNGSTSNEPSPVPVYTRAGSYSITLKVSTGECPGIATVVKNVTITAPPSARSRSFSTVRNEPIALATVNTGATYAWQPPIYLDTSDKAAPVFTGDAATQYRVTITTDASCMVVDTVNVKVEKESNILVPSAFTPNGDGRNERLFPFLFAIKQLQHFKIWNRWGLLVYESQADLPGWNGQYKGIAQPAGAYVWEAIGISFGNKTIQRKGLVVLIR